MQADWTRPDPRISDYLIRYDRYGIPFNAVYGPGAPSGIVLPELLSTEAVLEALGRAGGISSPSTQDLKRRAARDHFRRHATSAMRGHT